MDPRCSSIHSTCLKSMCQAVYTRVWPNFVGRYLVYKLDHECMTLEENSHVWKFGLYIIGVECC